MTKRVQRFGLVSATLATTVGLARELIMDLTNGTVTLHDGLTSGGIPLARKDLANVAVATGATNGILSAADKTKLDGIASSATNTPVSNVTPPAETFGLAAAVGVSSSAARADHAHALAAMPATYTTLVSAGTTSAPIGIVPGAAGTVLTSNGASAAPSYQAGVTFIKDYLTGFGLSNDGGSPNTVLDIAAGVGADSTNSTMITGTAFTKSTAGSWAAGSGGNGMGSGLTIGASTWYHVFAIINNGSFDVYFDTSITAANKPASTTAFLYIGDFKTNGSNNIIPFTQLGQVVLWNSPVNDVSSVTIGTSAVLTAFSIPSGVKVYPILHFRMIDNTNSGGVLGGWSPELGTTAPTNLTDNLLVQNVSSGVVVALTISPELLSNTSSQIYLQASLSTIVLSSGICRGWKNPHLASKW